MALDVFVKCVAKIPDTVSGDAFWYAEEGDYLWTLVVDGLGFGVEAAHAARLAVESISNDIKQLHRSERFEPDEALRLMMTQADKRLKSTRGAAVGLGLFDGARGEGRYIGVGNIELRTLGRNDHAHPICTPGIVGAGLRRLRVERFSYTLGQLILMHSDGLSSRFDLDVDTMLTRPLADVGEALIAKHGKKDDMTLLLVKQHA